MELTAEMNQAVPEEQLGFVATVRGRSSAARAKAVAMTDVDAAVILLSPAHDYGWASH